MRCEVCGSRILGKPRKVMIEGARMVVCEKCAGLGSTYVEPEIRLPKTSRMPVGKPSTVFSSAKTKVTDVQEGLELAESFGSIVREAREKLGLSHKDLGRRVSERVSVLKKVESEKMHPDKRLAMKLEHVLKVRLLVQAEEHEMPETVLLSSRLTLGEIARLKPGKERNPNNEGDDSP